MGQAFEAEKWQFSTAPEPGKVRRLALRYGFSVALSCMIWGSAS